MSLRILLGLEGTSLSDAEIMMRFKSAMQRNEDEVGFPQPGGTVIVIKLPHADFSKYIDPWDGK